MRLADFLLTTIQAFAAQGIATPELDARLLLEGVLEKDRAFCVLNPDLELIPIHLNRLDDYVKRRLNREPIAKILGQKEFWSLPFKTNAHTLDPRPDSETLIESVLKIFPDRQAALNILDLGTGTGCLLLSLLHEYPQARGVGVDVSPKALEVAKDNARTLGLADRAEFIKSSWFEKVQEKYEVILSNPPYIPLSHAQTLEPELSFDPPSALYGKDGDGLGDYRWLAQSMGAFLKPRGRVFLEFGQGQEKAVAEILKAQGFHLDGWAKDLGDIIRCGVFSRQI